MFTAQHYHAIAGVLAEQKATLDALNSTDPVVSGAQTALHATAWNLATLFANDNPRFKRETFMDACDQRGFHSGYLASA